MISRYFCKLGILLAVLLAGSVNAKNLTLPAWVSDHMVLPAGMSFALAGQADPGTMVVVRFGGQSVSTTADGTGKWSIQFQPLEAGLKGELAVEAGYEKKLITDVVTGDIWLCAGQSNMVRPVSMSAEAVEAVTDVQNADVRFYSGGSWLCVKPANVQKLSAVALFFAVEMYKKQETPVGIYVAAKGGTSIEAWMPVESFPDTDTGRRMRPLANDPEVIQAAAEDQAGPMKPYGQHRLARWDLGRAVPSSLFEQLVRPVADIPVRGVVWYQGENNASSLARAQEYRLWLESLISAYRYLWHNAELPFAIIQLPEYDSGSPDGRAGWAAVQKTQAEVAENTVNAVVVEIQDLGDPADIHPKRKRDVGRRAAEAVANLLNKK